MSEKRFIEQEVEKLSGAGVLGRSRSYARLLEYLAVCSVNDRTPKELEIASEVFGKGSDFDPNQDSLVRVYVHNLRQKLENYYARSENAGARRLAIPRGEYRLAVLSADEGAASGATRRRGPPLWAVALTAALVVNFSALIYVGLGEAPAENVYDEVAASPLWANVMEDDLPLLVVVGDYYIFAELDDFGGVRRLVREFDINSADDLEDRFLFEPELMESYLDVDLSYLPEATASALKDLLRIVYRSDKPVRVTAMSELDIDDLTSAHVLYVGYISALDKLMDFVFAASGLALGDTFDEITNVDTGETYLSGAGIPRGERGNYRDYGLFSTFPGPADNQVMVIAGTRDEGLTHTARAVTLPASVATLEAGFAEEGANDAVAFEALYEVTGVDRTNLDAALVYTGRLDYRAIWGGSLR